ncbi:MAG: hypothetical protein P1U74_09020 [Legionellaceae bacterium]|nr:hypothetical protein [Legionellaceae bacterium]
MNQQEIDRYLESAKLTMNDDISEICNITNVANYILSHEILKDTLKVEDKTDIASKANNTMRAIVENRLQGFSAKEEQTFAINARKSFISEVSTILELYLDTPTKSCASSFH